jgi:hypothetical protein
LYARITQDGRDSLAVVEQTLLAAIQKNLNQWRSSVVFSFDPGRVRGLTLHQEGRDVEVLKDGGGWKISKPLTAGADENEVRGFLAGLLEIRATQFVTDNPAEFGAYNMNSPYLVLDVRLDRGTVSLSVSKTDAAGEVKYYAQEGSRPAVFALPKETVDAMTNLVDTVRDRRILRLGGAEQVQAIDYRRGGLAIAISAAPGVGPGWRLATGEPLPVDPAEVQTLLARLGNARRRR